MRHFFWRPRRSLRSHFLWLVGPGFSRRVYRRIFDQKQLAARFEFLYRLGLREMPGRLILLEIPRSFVRASETPPLEAAALCPAPPSSARTKPDDRSVPVQLATSRCLRFQPAPDGAQALAHWLNLCPL